MLSIWQEENEVPDDDLINEMIARSEDELELFKQIDIERKKTETHSRLIEECELPDWLVKDDDEVVCSKVSFLLSFILIVIKNIWNIGLIDKILVEVL